jgi:hypothetical protein
VRPQDHVGRFLYVGDWVQARCQGRKVYGRVTKLTETWCYVEHEPVQQRPSKPKTHTIRVRQWTVYQTWDGRPDDAHRYPVAQGD